MESPVFTINKLLNALAVHDATEADISSFLIGQGKDAETVAGALAQLQANQINRTTFLGAFGYA